MEVHKISISTLLFEKIIAHCYSSEQMEACGVLIGRRENGMAEVSEVVPVENIKKSPDRFTVDPESLYAVWNRVEEEGKDLIGNYHSHPRSGPYPSGLDIENMRYSGFVWVIVGKDKDAKAFTYEDTLKEVTIEKK